jgi:hypothetical protein
MGADKSNDEDLEAEAFEPSWTQKIANEAIGKRILAGVTYLEPDGVTVRSHEQYHGVITSVDPKQGVTVRCEGAHEGKTICLPPHDRVFTPAGPGDYSLHSTGEVVTDPDFVTTWSVAASIKH